MNILDKGMTIGWAVSCLKAGRRVRRAGWNGKGMFLFLVPGSTFKVDRSRATAPPIPDGQQINYLPHVDMFTAQGDLVPWLCSQTDLLAEDWEVVEDAQSGPPWTEWAGGDKAPTTAFIECELRDGSRSQGWAIHLEWRHAAPGKNPDFDIIRYRET